MTTTSAGLLWVPRVLGIALGLFLALFALDAFESGKPFWHSVTDALIHLLPSALVLSLVALSWRWPSVAGFAFLALAAGYALTTGFRPDWVAVISGPLLIVGLLFLWAGRHHDEHGATRPPAAGGAARPHSDARVRRRGAPSVAPARSTSDAPRESCYERHRSAKSLETPKERQQPAVYRRDC